MIKIGGPSYADNKIAETTARETICSVIVKNIDDILKVLWLDIHETCRVCSRRTISEVAARATPSKIKKNELK